MIHIVFDNGCLRDKPEESQRVMESLMMPMMGKSSYSDMADRLRIVQAHDKVFQRIAMV